MFSREESGASQCCCQSLTMLVSARFQCAVTLLVLVLGIFHVGCAYDDGEFVKVAANKV